AEDLEELAADRVAFAGRGGGGHARAPSSAARGRPRRRPAAASMVSIGRSGRSGRLADLPAEEGDDAAVVADDVADLLGRVHDEGLLEEGDLLVELAHAALDDLLGDLAGLARLHGLLEAEASLLLDQVGRDVVGGDAQRA